MLKAGTAKQHNVRKPFYVQYAKTLSVSFTAGYEGNPVDRIIDTFYKWWYDHRSYNYHPYNQDKKHI
jgi:hypothetical protein